MLFEDFFSLLKDFIEINIGLFIAKSPPDGIDSDYIGLEWLISNLLGKFLCFIIVLIAFLLICYYIKKKLFKKQSTSPPESTQKENAHIDNHVSTQKKYNSLLAFIKRFKKGNKN